jgi:hypothetical protein
LAQGNVHIFVVGADFPDSQLPTQAIFRYVHVADASIPEPPTAMLSAILFAGVFAWQCRRWR